MRACDICEAIAQQRTSLQCAQRMHGRREKHFRFTLQCEKSEQNSCQRKMKEKNASLRRVAGRTNKEVCNKNLFFSLFSGDMGQLYFFHMIRLLLNCQFRCFLFITAIQHDDTRLDMDTHAVPKEA